MKIGGILNSEIAKIVDDLGHTDRIVICDCGLPIPRHLKKIDIAVSKNNPQVDEIVLMLKKHMTIESVTIAIECQTENPAFNNFVTDSFENIEYVAHEKFKILTKDSTVFIRTGDAHPYANIILQSGVDFSGVLCK